MSNNNLIIIYKCVNMLFMMDTSHSIISVYNILLEA